MCHIIETSVWMHDEPGKTLKVVGIKDARLERDGLFPMFVQKNVPYELTLDDDGIWIRGKVTTQPIDLVLLELHGSRVVTVRRKIEAGIHFHKAVKGVLYPDSMLQDCRNYETSGSTAISFPVLIQTCDVTFFDTGYSGISAEKAIIPAPERTPLEIFSDPRKGEIAWIGLYKILKSIAK